ncbi:hypothetical protein L2Y94_11000 [Luteibacter aegosomatis]|uniref:SbcC/MukB-like Walker B domain-containing protein n=1 Tax=Luteibacter aegosomatis TaxID=2911537 RepID=UPI001FFA2A5E|nr:SbcC/MukB-like Walker B domain-containing protein [Luteibacter aegosomatis]UPG83886.1 hypothetical protein L2Y94_11000 [Luteibacter aegosomatis]
MKHLEAIGMVQYFLYERKDLQIGRNTAFLGPNGTGKTALLDAIQIVLLAADENLMNFNAAGEGKKRARRLRDYCLGVYGQTESEHKRTVANTYINLVFRDPFTGAVVTAGASISASADSTEVVRNLYILPGVALTTAAHVEQGPNGEQTLQWRRFHVQASDLCRQAGTVPFYTTNGSEFARRLYIGELPSPGEKPNVRSIRAAFARSLKLNKDVDDLDETLRHHLIESRPTNVKQFRARLDQFRAVREMIRRVTARIEQAKGVEERYAVVQRERAVQTNLNALRAVYDSERVAETLGEVEEQLEKYRAELEAADLAYQRSSEDHRIARDAHTRAVEARSRDPDYAKQAGDAGRLTDQQTRLTATERTLSSMLDGLLTTVAQAGLIPALADAQGDFEDAIAQLDDLKRGMQSVERPDPVTIQATAKAVGRIHDVVRKALFAAEADARAATDRKRDARTALDRAQRNQADLSPNVLALQRFLSDAGIETTPVCDLVSLKDAAWQPAIEAYLALNVEALLVPADKELEAIDVYRGLRGANSIYGVKLALPSRGRDWRAPDGERYAAQMITGESKAAVRYLQGELGRLALAESSRELQVGVRALSAEGMLSTGGGIERLRSRAPSELKIGRSKDEARRAVAERALREAEDAARMAEQAAAALKASYDRLAQYGDTEDTRTFIEGAFGTIVGTRQLVQDLENGLAASQTDRLAGLNDAMIAAGKRLDAALAAMQQHGEAKTRCGTLIETTEKDRSRLATELSLASQTEAEFRQHPLYDAKAVNDYRERYDERHGDDWKARIDACTAAAGRAGSAAQAAQMEGWHRFCEYAVTNDIRNHDIGSSEWQRAYAYISEDRQRLEELELAQQMAKAEEAYEAAVKVFRTDVAQALLEGFEAVDEQIASLNQVLKHAPEFSNGERYQFRYRPVPQHEPLYAFLRRVRDAGDAEGDLFGGAGKVPEEFRTLVDGSADSELLNDTSPLNDHRRFFAYDVEIYRDDKSMGWLSKRLGPGSGGEHRTPLYVIFGAALAAAYGKARGTEGSGGVMLLDEAFEKMDPQNVRATADYLNSLGLQLIMAGPEADQAKMSSFLDIYYDMARFGSNVVQMTKNIVEAEARELLQSDNFLLHPELLDQEERNFEEDPRVPG